MRRKPITPHKEDVPQTYKDHSSIVAIPIFLLHLSLFYLFVIIFSAAGRGLTTHWMQWYFYLGAGKSFFF